MDKKEILAEIEILENRKKQAEALYLKCEGGIEVYKRMLEKSKSKDKPIVKKEK